MIRQLIDIISLPAAIVLLYDCYISFTHKAIPFYFSPHRWKVLVLVSLVICVLSILT